MGNFTQPTRKYSLSAKLRKTLALFCLIMLLISCGQGSIEAPPDKVQGFSQSHNKDQITLTLQTSKKEITIAEQLELVLATAVPENIDVEFPSYSAGLGDFTLLDTMIHPPSMTGAGEAARVVHQASYQLEPYLSGTYTIPAMAVTFRDKQNNGAAVRLMTEEIDVAVQSLLPSGAGQADIKDIRPPLPLPPNRARQFLLAGMALLLAGFAIAGYVIWKKKNDKKSPVAVPLRPDEIALQQLDKLLAENLLARGEIKHFHLRISDILRHYIENRFGLKAPERTTEEFLTQLSGTKSAENGLLGSHKSLLADFLTQCDLVKFAKHEPTLAESEKTVVICREFVEKTKEGFEENFLA